MNEKKQPAINPAPCSSDCYAFLESNGTIDLDSIAETEDEVRWKVLEGSMGWRFDHPGRYNRDEEWNRLLTFGEVVSVSVSVSQLELMDAEIAQEDGSEAGKS